MKTKTLITQEGDRRIYRRGNEYLISEYGCWIPGVYADEEAARAAFGFDSWELQGIQRRLNESQADPAKRVITLAMLNEERHARKEKTL